MAGKSKGRGKSTTSRRKVAKAPASKVTAKKAAAPKKKTASRAKAASATRTPRAGQGRVAAVKTSVTLIARDPVTAFAAWDAAPDAAPTPGLLRVLEGEKVRQELEVSLDWGGASIAGLEPGKTFRVELSAGRAKQTTRLGVSNPVKLPGRGAQPPKVTSPARTQDSFVFVTPDSAPPRPSGAEDPEPGFADSKQRALIDMSTPGTGLSSSRGGSTLSGRR